ncbi:MAG: threonine ammonia-lyase IlvA [Sediminibacterium sp.]|nr:threonine ammonia-lyase IlvA [Sediminibacterium sp.]
MPEELNHNYNIDITAALKRLQGVVAKTPLILNRNLSKKYNCNIYFKREDLQIVRSYKIRGAYNMISSLSQEDLAKGVVCASAGNHAQGFAYSCNLLKVKGVVFMPTIAQSQKVAQTQMFGDKYVEVKLIGDTYDDCSIAAKKFTEENNMVYIPPFDNELIIAGQATVGVEIDEDLQNIDYIFVPVGGGGLCSGIISYFNKQKPNTQIVGIEPAGAPAMANAIKFGSPVTLDNIDSFVDGAAVKRIGNITFNICRNVLKNNLILVPEGKVCTTILDLYTKEAIVVEPAGALSVAALDFYADKIKGKNIVCIISGSNNNIDRLQEIKERSLLYEGLKHYFIIRFAQRPGVLKEFVNKVLGESDDITRFEYIQKNNKESGPALIGIEVKTKNDYELLLKNFHKYQINFTELNNTELLSSYLI